MSHQYQGPSPLYDGSAYDDSEYDEPAFDPHLPPPKPTWYPRDHPQQQPRPTSQQRSGLPSQQRAASQSDRPSSSRAMIQQPTGQTTQWPLVDDKGQHVVKTAQSPEKGPPPARPPRPNQAPLAPNPPHIAPNSGPQSQAIPQYRQEPSVPTNRYAQQDSKLWDDDESASPTYPAPNLSRPLTGSSRASTSSNYSLPDFPVPQISQQMLQQQAQPLGRRPPLGPPPSARRGPSSYYPQASFVSPIVEETESIYSQRSTRAPHDSYASSNAIPIGIPKHYLSGAPTPTPDNESPFDERYEENSDDNSSVENVDVEEVTTAVPVRQASVGHRSRPTMTTIKSSDGASTRSFSEKTEEPQTASLAQSSAAHAMERNPSERPNVLPRARTSSSGVLGRFDSSHKDEKNLREKRSKELLASHEQASAGAPPAKADSGTADASANTEKGFSVQVLDLDEKQGSLAKRVGSRRPPRLNVDAVKEAETRGSLTSLSDLIRRATKLASNLDRGKTASRYGDWFGDGRHASQVLDKRRSGNSLADILASFPPPGVATPDDLSPGRGAGHWQQSRLRHSTLPSESDPGEIPQRQQRRCCGMPRWVFILLLLLLLLIVAAAVVVPVCLVLLHRESNNVHTSSKALESCRQSMLCENGGSSIVSNTGSCGCVCVNGYSGGTCSKKTSLGCTTADVGGTSNATLGDAIPHVISWASTNFSVPLDAVTILQVFSSNNLSCTSENALVTFNGLSSRSIQLESIDVPSQERREMATPTWSLHKRVATSSSASTAVTSNGIVFDNTPTSTSSATSTPTASAASNSSSSTSAMLDFARVAVLYVLQDSGNLDDGIAAQESLQDFFTSGTTREGGTIDVKNVTLTTGYTANLEQHVIVTSSGASVGG